MEKLAKKSALASKELMSLSSGIKAKIFDELITNLKESEQEIASKNEMDISAAKEQGLPSALVDRLNIQGARFESMLAGIEQIKNQKEIVGEFYNEFESENGLRIKKQRVPLGVILMIFESRPNVVVDCAALAIKSSNAIILKGGKEARHTNEVLGNIIKITSSNYIPEDTVTVLSSDDRSQVNQLLSFDQYIDVVIPRGGEKLIRFVSETAKMPVIAHYKGLCHMYVDKFADQKKAIDLIVNAKTQRPGVCNAIETLLVHKDVLRDMAPKIYEALLEKKTQLRVDKAFMQHTSKELTEATNEDWETEYLDNILSIKTVDSMNDAIEHIREHGSKHSECIISKDDARCEEFMNKVDASCVMVNASTRFNDGSQLGLGAELGISTSKIHAYGPMGVEQMTTSRYVVVGNGQVRQ